MEQLKLTTYPLLQKAICIGRWMAASVPEVAIGVQAIQIMPEHCAGQKYSLTAARSAADVIGILGIVPLMYPVCPVRQVK